MHVCACTHAFTDPVGQLVRDVHISLECLLNKIGVTTHTKTEELLITYKISVSLKTVVINIAVAHACFKMSRCMVLMQLC
jgi:hypothetical protein